MLSDLIVPGRAQIVCDALTKFNPLDQLMSYAVANADRGYESVFVGLIQFLGGCIRRSVVDTEEDRKNSPDIKQTEWKATATIGVFARRFQQICEAATKLEPSGSGRMKLHLIRLIGKSVQFRSSLIEKTLRESQAIEFALVAAYNHPDFCALQQTVVDVVLEIIKSQSLGLLRCIIENFDFFKVYSAEQDAMYVRRRLRLPSPFVCV